jgi:hypothetical protein
MVKLLSITRGLGDYSSLLSSITKANVDTGKGLSVIAFWITDWQTNASIVSTLHGYKILVNEKKLGNSVILAIHGSEQTLINLARGDYDARIRSLGTMIAQEGLIGTIRFYYEANGDWASHSRTKDNFIAGFKRFSDVIKIVNDKVQMMFAMAPSSRYGTKPGWKDYYPGDQYVDIIGPSLHDYTAKAQGTAHPTAVDAVNFLLDPHIQFAASHGKPMFLPETSWYDKDNSDNYKVTLTYASQFINAVLDKVEEENNNIYGVSVYGLDYISSRPTIQATYRQRISIPLYVDGSYEGSVIVISSKAEQLLNRIKNYLNTPEGAVMMLGLSGLVVILGEVAIYESQG